MGVVPELRIENERDPAVFGPPGLASSPPRVWRDRDGGTSALGRSSGTDHEMEVPGVGSFFFDEEPTADVALVPEDGADGDLIDDAYRRMVVPMVLQVRGIEVLHASGVRRSDGVTALCGTSGSGKSTLAYGLSTRAGELWADDVVPFTVAGSHVRVLPVPFKVRLLPDAAGTFLGTEMVGSGKTTLKELHAPSGEARLSRIFVLERGAAVSVERVRPATRAFPMLLEHAYTFDATSGAHVGRTATSYARLVASVPIRALSVPPGLDTLDPVLDRIESAIAEDVDDR